MLLENFYFLQENAPWFFAGFSFCLGAIVGSFLNVCIYRIPAEQSVVKPGSRCGFCGAPIPWYYNIPIITWFQLRGKTACCGKSYSFRYAFVEILTGLFFLWAWLTHEPIVAVIGMLFAAILIATTFIDLDHMIIPLRFSVGGMILGVILSFAFPELHGFSATDGLVANVKSGILSVIGVLVGSGTIYWIRLLAEIALRKEAMGAYFELARTPEGIGDQRWFDLADVPAPWVQIFLICQTDKIDISLRLDRLQVERQT